METLAIEGGIPLTGSVRVHGAKNAALPILAAAIMANGESVIHDVPDLKDIHVMNEILQSLEVSVKRDGNSIIVSPRGIQSTEIADDMMRQMRSSIFLMGPILSRFGNVRVSTPGGCSIGSRPIDLHVKGLRAMGAEIQEKFGYMECTASRLKGANIYLDFPSVGATENLMMAATLADGQTTIWNAAREPEIVDLANFLNKMGAKVKGAGEDVITIIGVERLHGTEHSIIPDRIVTGTLMLAAAITGGHVELQNVIPQHVGAISTKLRETGVEIKVDRDIITVETKQPLSAIDRLQTAPYPGFPTDMQAPFMSLLTVARGTSVIIETIFEDRFKQVSELRRMGAKIKVDLRTAFVQGVSELTGAVVEATDLRAGAALVLAGLAAQGTTTIKNLHHIDRGYETVEDMFQNLGANITRLR